MKYLPVLTLIFVIWISACHSSIPTSPSSSPTAGVVIVSTATPQPTLPTTVNPTPSPLATPTPPGEPTPVQVESLDPLARIGGVTSAVLTKSRDGSPYLYLGLGQTLMIMDISRPAQPERTGTLSLPGLIRDLEVVEDYLYVRDSGSGLSVIDVSDPAAPIQIGNYKNEMYSAQGIAVGDNYAYLATYWYGLRIVDISNPARMVEVGAYVRDPLDYETNRIQTGWDVAIQENYAYLIGEDSYNNFNGLYILDVSEPTAPVEVSVYQTPRPARRVIVSGRYVYLLIPKMEIYPSDVGRDGTLHIVDIQDPKRPKAVGFYNIPGYARDLAIQDNFVYITTGDGSGKVYIADVTEPTAPVEAGIFNPTEETVSLLATETHLYLAGYEGFSVADLSQPARPREVNTYITPDLIKDAIIAGTKGYLASGSGGLQVLDLSNPAWPIQAGFYNTPGYALGVANVGAYFYVADELSGLRIIDVSNPVQPVEVGVYDSPGEVRQVVVSGSYAYVTGDGFLRVADISNPAKPVEVGLYEGPAWVEQVAVSGQLAGVVFKEKGLRIVDLTVPNRPQEVGEYETEKPIQAVILEDKFAYLVVEGSLYLLDISNPAHPVEVSAYDPDGWIQDALIAGDKAYVLVDRESLHVVDISNPDLPAATNIHQLPEPLDWIRRDGASLYGLELRQGRLVVFPPLPDLASSPASPSPSPQPGLMPAVVPSPTVLPSPTVTLPLLSSPQAPSTTLNYAYNVAALGHLGGKGRAITEAGGYLYTGFGSELAILDISTPTRPTRIGYTVLPALVEEIYVAGDYAYVIEAEEHDLWLVDVSTPTAPVPVGFLGEAGGINDLQVAGNYVYLATWLRGLVIVDVSNPAAPSIVSDLDTQWWHTHEIVVVGDYAYLAADWKGLGIADISDPANPVHTGVYKEDTDVNQVSLVDGYLVLNGGQEVLDISDPTAPLEVGYALPPAWDRVVMKGYTYTLDETGDLVVLDTASSSIAVEVGSYETWATTENVALNRGTEAGATYLYLVAGEGQHRILDVARPDEPRVIATYQFPDLQTLEVVIQDHYVYQVAGRQAIRSMDLSQPDRRGSIGWNYNPSMPATALDFVTVGKYGYLANGREGVEIWDISAGLSGRRLGEYRWPRFFAHQVAGSGDYLYVTGYSAEYDLSGYRFITQFSLRVLDISDPARPVEVGHYPLPNWAWDLVAAGNYVYVVDGRGGLHILDISVPTAPKEISRYYLPNQAYSLALGPGPISGTTYAYVAAGKDGLHLIDVSSPATPVLAGFYQTASAAWDVAVEGQNIYVADDRGGLTILRPTLPIPPSTELDSANTPNLPFADPNTQPSLILSPDFPLPRTEGCAEPPSCLSPISPQEIVDRLQRNEVETLRDIWHKLGIGWDPEEFLADSLYVQRLDLQADTPYGPEVIIQITGGWSIHYQLFRRQGNNWIFLGYINSLSKYASGEGPRLRTSREGESWLIIQEDGGGTGVYLNTETWFWLGEKGPKPVLEYPLSGHLSQPIPYWKSFDNHVFIDDEDPYTVEVWYQADYDSNYQDDEALVELPLFTLTSSVRYIWQPEVARFVLDPLHSGLSSQQIEYIYSWEEELITPAFEQLLHLARSGDKARKAWLRRYLSDKQVPPVDGPEKKLLLQLVD